MGNFGEALGGVGDNFLKAYTTLNQDYRARAEEERLKAAQALEEQVKQAKLKEYANKGLMGQAIQAKMEEINKPFMAEYLDPTTGKTEKGMYENRQTFWEHQGQDPNEELMKIILPVVSQHDPELAVKIASQMIRSKTMRDVAGQKATGQQDALPKPPSGFRYQGTNTPPLERIPGGPKDDQANTWETHPALNYKVDTEHGKYVNQADDLVGNMQNLKTNALDLMDHPGLAANVGWSGMVPNLKGTEAAEARRLMDTITSQSALTTLQNIRKASPTGGAVGNVSDKDIEMLKSYIVALNRSTNVKDYKKALRNIADFADSKTENVKSDYKRRWAKYEGIYEPEKFSSYGNYTLSTEEQEAFNKGAKKPGNYQIGDRILYYDGKNFTHRNKKY